MTTLRVATWNIEDALTGEVLARGFLSEQLAEGRLKKLRRKHPAAFCKKAEKKQ